MTDADFPPHLWDDLPAVYLRALRLQRAGASAEQLAAALDVPVESVDALLRIAEAKQAAAVFRSAPCPDQ